MAKYLDIAIANEQINPVSIKGKNYSEVNQRIKAFRMVYPQGTITTQMISNQDGICIFKAVVIDDHNNILGTGHAYEKEDSSFINQTSYIENCETSAVGRALGMAGFGIDVSVASAEEVQNAINNQTITQEQADNYTLKFGKYKGKTIKEVYKDDPKYIDWMITNSQDEMLLKTISMATGIVIPSNEEMEQRLELINKINQKVNEDNLSIEDIHDKYNVNSIRELSIEQLKEILKGE